MAFNPNIFGNSNLQQTLNQNIQASLKPKDAPEPQPMSRMNVPATKPLYVAPRRSTAKQILEKNIVYSETGQKTAQGEHDVTVPEFSKFVTTNLAILGAGKLLGKGASVVNKLSGGRISSAIDYGQRLAGFKPAMTEEYFQSPKVITSKPAMTEYNPTTGQSFTYKDVAVGYKPFGGVQNIVSTRTTLGSTQTGTGLVESTGQGIIYGKITTIPTTKPLFSNIKPIPTATTSTFEVPFNVPSKTLIMGSATQTTPMSSVTKTISSGESTGLFKGDISGRYQSSFGTRQFQPSGFGQTTYDVESTLLGKPTLLFRGTNMLEYSRPNPNLNLPKSSSVTKAPPKAPSFKPLSDIFSQKPPSFTTPRAEPLTSTFKGIGTPRADIEAFTSAFTGTKTAPSTFAGEMVSKASQLDVFGLSTPKSMFTAVVPTLKTGTTQGTSTFNAGKTVFDTRVSSWSLVTPKTDVLVTPRSDIITTTPVPPITKPEIVIITKHKLVPPITMTSEISTMQIVAPISYTPPISLPSAPIITGMYIPPILKSGESRFSFGFDRKKKPKGKKLKYTPSFTSVAFGLKGSKLFKPSKSKLFSGIEWRKMY
jgi:hypothetical protein